MAEPVAKSRRSGLLRNSSSWLAVCTSTCTRKLTGARVLCPCAWLLSQLAPGISPGEIRGNLVLAGSDFTAPCIPKVECVSDLRDDFTFEVKVRFPQCLLACLSGLVSVLLSLACVVSPSHVISAVGVVSSDHGRFPSIVFACCVH